MVDIPDSWPIDDEVGDDGPVVPMFPLRDVFLFPGQLLPLHIFEPRYRQMIQDSLDGPGRLLIATVLDDRPGVMAGSPDVQPIAGLGEIGQHHKLPDGRFLIWLVGLARVRVHEAATDTPYRVARFEPMEEVAAIGRGADELQPELQRAIQTRVGQDVELPDSVTTGQLTDILSQCLQLPPSLMAQIYAENRVQERARMVLDAHRKFPSRKR